MDKDLEFDVFLSYSSKDKTIVKRLAERLKQDGLQVWLDEWAIEPGDPISLKIQQGIEKSRTLLLCMSPAYFKSEWASLEHHTLLFRDPTNAKRSFIPIRIKKCKPPDIIAQFAYIDWHLHSDEAYEKLLAACRRKKAEPAKPSEGNQQPDSRPMVLKSHTGFIFGVALTPDGKTIVSSSEDKTIKLWDLKTGKCRATLKGHNEKVYCVALTPDGKTIVSGADDKTIKLWDLKTRKCRDTLKGHTELVINLALTSEGKTIVSTSYDNTLKLWDLKTRKCRDTLKGNNSPIYCVALTPDGKTIVSGADDKTIKLWDLKTRKCRDTLKGNNSPIYCVALTPDGKTIVSGAEDSTIKLWDLKSGKCRATLEGHTGWIASLALTPDGKTIVSGAEDKTIKLWDLKSGKCRATLKGHTETVRTLTLPPDGKTIISGSYDKTLRVWKMPELGKVIQSGDHARYTNAKVILAGDTGVGKSGLAIRLTQDDFQLTSSTDGHWASQFPLPQGKGKTGIDREVWLWDFAGQPDYRLIHQLFMDETALAVYVFNPQHENPFEGIGQWDRDLEKAASRPFKKLLVAGRCDRGGLMVTQKSIQEFRRKRNFIKFIETSAKTGKGCDVLRQTINKNIDWKSLPWTSSSRIFRKLKEEIIILRDKEIVLLRMTELKQRLEMQMAGELFSLEELRAVVSLLAGPGLIWKLEFGDFVVLQPEKINAYASAVIRKVRKHTDEIGCILEQDIIKGDLEFQDMERLPSDEESIILRAMHQTFVDHGICLREETDNGTQLIFPSLFKRERPELEGHPAIFTSYQFQGGADEIYTTLVVRLHRTATFDNDKLWKFAADFKTPSKKRVGIKMIKRNEGAAELTVYCDPQIPDDTKVTFIKYVHEHLLRKGSEVFRYRHYVCKCNYPVKDSELARDLLQEKGKKASITCQKCGKKVPLWDLMEEKFASEEFHQRVRELEEESKVSLDNESKELILVGQAFSVAGEAGQIYRPCPNSDHGIDGEIEFKNDGGEASGHRVYLQLKFGDSYLRKRKADNKEIFSIKKARHSKYWQDQAYPVMLVIATSDKVIRWMNVSDYLKKHGENTKQIIFEGEPFTALNLVKLRNKILEQH
jgi:small GTP-binding protein